MLGCPSLYSTSQSLAVCSYEEMLQALSTLTCNAGSYHQEPSCLAPPALGPGPIMQAA